ncbi:hypothetical protein PF001_g31791 [Phytophthora fragariae]|uniref:Uncharacterized protein n=1 Tax=Phytophthora fragariae TaxID=53985 RepID=A0A6A3QFY3_9STRA|nr:hypothetical protein PF006_g28301 [Phytophthora fragariae]KAE9263159.1 hypothetical protein PF001_g31791 [Phytophthora fragariae]KAE9264842.1 hypothetical protein PF008_g32020 [Phytophthora fragariae]
MSATSGVLFSSTSTWACPSTRRIRDGTLGDSNSVSSVSALGRDGILGSSSSSLLISSSKWTRRFWFRVITVAVALASADESVLTSA